MNKLSISAFFPVYNEEKNIQQAVEGLLPVLKDVCQGFEIILVNDGSTDKTAKVAERLALKHQGSVKIVHHPKNLGYGAAVKSGMAAARYDWVFFTDADNQFDAEDLKTFIPHTAKFPVVIGYRRHRHDPFHRRLLGFGWTHLGRNLFNLPVRDVNCAFKLIKRDLVKDIKFQSGGATISIELLVHLKRQGAKFKELPVRHFPRVSGQPTGGNFKVITRAFREFLALYRTFNQMK